MEEKRGEVAWNIVAEQTKFISELIRKATDSYLRGDIGSWFNILTAVRENINYDIKPNENKALNIIEKDCWNTRKYWYGYSKALIEKEIPRKELVEKKKEFVSHVRDYSRKLFDILNDLGYFPKKEDRTKLSF